MTEEQEKLAESNVRLIRYAARQYAYLPIPFDERQGIAGLALTKAAISWRPGSAAFSTWAMHIILQEMLMSLRHKRITCTSLDEPNRDTDGNTPILDSVPCDDVAHETLEFHETMEIIKALPTRQRESLMLSAYGVNQTEIAKRFGVSQTQVSKYIRRARETVRVRMGAV
jgi:RNA polymerase sigma factor (sigma-70 family)